MLSAPDAARGHGPLIAALQDCGAQVLMLSDEIGRRLFSHVGPENHMVWQ